MKKNKYDYPYILSYGFLISYALFMIVAIIGVLWK
jgi:hypothetical protein